MSDSVIIVGGGFAGLSAGCYAQMNGYKTQVFEMGERPGGLCTAWERGGYTVDGCVHWLTGSAPGNNFYQLWEELGLLPGPEIINIDQLYRFEDAAGKVFTLYTDMDKLEAHMKELAPEDDFAIKEFCQAVRKFSRLHMPVGKPPELVGKFENIKLVSKMAPFMTELAKWSRLTMKDLAGHFRNPLLHDAFVTIWPPKVSAVGLLLVLATMHEKQSGYPLGGSLPLSRALEKRYRGLGGDTRYKSRVTAILVEKDRAVGVKLADGTEQRAGAVVWGADAHTAIFDLLGGRYLDDKLRRQYNTFPVFDPIVYVALGVKRTFPDLPQIASGIFLPLETPLELGGLSMNWLGVRVHNFDPSLAPAGSTLLTAMLYADFDHWTELAKDPARYRDAKAQVAETVIQRLDKRFPGLAAQVEMRDVATPVTFHRYTGNRQGSFEGWLSTSEVNNTHFSKTLPGLADFYLAGQWVQAGGGLPSGAMTGRHVAQFLCKRDKKDFTTSKP